jgi:hypothetical protein
MLERLIDYINGHDGVRWATMEEIADDFVQRYPRSEPNHDPGINIYGIDSPAAEAGAGAATGQRDQGATPSADEETSTAPS